MAIDASSGYTIGKYSGKLLLVLICLLCFCLLDAFGELNSTLNSEGLIQLYNRDGLYPNW